MLQGRKEFVCGENPPFQSCHASSMAALADGSYLCVWFAGSKEGADDVNIWSSRRINGIWNTCRILAQGNLPHWNPVLFVRPNGTVLLFYKIGREIASWQTWVMESYDNGISWSQPKELVPGDKGGRGPVRNKIILLSNGRWLAPASLENGEWRCFTDFSDNNGATWHKSNEIHINLKQDDSASSVSRRGIIQPTLWETDRGAVHMLMRSSEGAIFRSDSTDYGTSWCPAYKTNLPNNNSGIDLIRVLDGRLFLVYNPVGTNWGSRYPLMISCSHDNGISWQKVFTLEEGPGEYSYPAIITDQSNLLVSYTSQRKNIAFWKLELK